MRNMKTKLQPNSQKLLANNRVQILPNQSTSEKKVIIISKSTNFNHIKEDLGALGWKMKKEDLNLLDKAFK